jgi:hypothetical protein
LNQEPVAGEPAHDPLDEAVEETLEAPRVGCPDAMEPGTVLLQRLDAVLNQHMEMDVQVQGAAETLGQGDNAGSGAAAGRESCPVGQIGLDGSDDD